MDEAELRAAIEERKSVPPENLWVTTSAEQALPIDLEELSRGASSFTAVEPEPKVDQAAKSLAAPKPPPRSKLVEERSQVASEQRSKEVDPGMLGPRYRVEKILGIGGMGTVYKARHVALGRDVAIKVLSPEMSREPKVVDRLRREASAAQRVRHPNVVAVLGIEMSKAGQPCVVMELLEGWSLATRLKAKGKLDRDSVARLGMQIGDALNASHLQGVVHRDVKPDNIFLVGEDSGEPTFKLLDYGAALVANTPSITKDGAWIGTPSYMSPEQALGGDVTQRSDVFSLGLVMYEAATGRNPFAEGDRTLPETIARIVSFSPAFPMNGPSSSEDHSALDAIVERALAKDPLERWESAAALSKALRSAAAGRLPQEAPRPSAGPVRGLSKWKWVGVALAIGVTAALGLVSMQGRAQSVRVDVVPSASSACPMGALGELSSAASAALDRIRDVETTLEGGSLVLSIECESTRGSLNLRAVLIEAGTARRLAASAITGSDLRHATARAVVEIATQAGWRVSTSLARETATTTSSVAARTGTTVNGAR